MKPENNYKKKQGNSSRYVEIKQQHTTGTTNESKKKSKEKLKSTLKMETQHTKNYGMQQKQFKGKFRVINFLLRNMNDLK